MKRKKILVLFLMAIIALVCSFAVACDNNTDSGSEANSNPSPSPAVMMVELNEESGELSFTEIIGAVKYKISLCEYQKDPITYTSDTNSYHFEKLVAGDYRITVLALDEADKEIGNGSISITLARNIGMPQSPTDLSISEGTLTWATESTSVSYTVEAVNCNEIKATKSSLTDCTLSLSELGLHAGIYDVNVYGIAVNGVKGTAGTIRYVVYGNSVFNQEKTDGEYYLADFKTDDIAFIENDGATLIDDETKVGLAYKEALWYNVGVWYTLPEPIKWNEVYQLKMRTRVTQVSSELESKKCYAYLFNEEGKFNGIFPEEAWTGNGTEKVEDDGDGWKLTTFSAENIRLRGINFDNTYDYFWQYGEAEYLTKIFFSATGENAAVEIDYVSYTKREAATGFDVTYKNLPLEDEYTTVDKFDWSQLGAVGDKNYTVDYRLEKDGIKVEFEKEQRLEAGEYKLTAIVRGKYFGKVEKYFKVVETNLLIPSGVTNLRYDIENEKLSWSAAENAEKYRITVKDLNGALIEEVKEVTGTECTISSIPVGTIYIVVIPISADGVEGRDVLIEQFNPGNTNFNAPKNPDDANCTCVNVAALDNADYTYFFTANDDETISYVDGGGIKATDASAEENGKTVAGATLSLPKPLDVKNKDFIISFTFKYVKGAGYTIWLYNEENKGAYGYCYSEDGYTEGGGLSAKTVDGVTTVKISSAKIAENNFYCDWTNQTAKQITKIKIMNGTSEFVLTGIELSEQPTIISGGSTESFGYNGVVLADFEKNSDTCQNAYITDGNLVVKADTLYAYELPTAVEVTPGSSQIRIRFKGGDPYFKFYDSDGNLLLTTTQTAGKENDYSAGFFDWPNHTWGGGVNITKVTDGDYIIITVSGEKVVGSDVKKIVFEAHGTDLYVDYITVSTPVPIDPEKTYTITYDLGINKYATISSTTQTVAYGETLNLAMPQYSGSAQFLGWYIADENGNATTQKVESGNEYLWEKDVTLIAKWQEWSEIVS